jgi:fibronectin-binding autotransporter adhesin
MMKTSLRKQSTCLGAICAAVLLTAHSNAANIIKTNNSDALDLTTSWEQGVVPTAADIAVWNSVVAAENTTNDIGAGVSFGGILFGLPGGNIVLTNSGAGTIGLGANGVDLTASRTLTVYSPVVLNSDQTWQLHTGGTDSNHAAGVVINGVISGAGKLTIAARDGFPNRSVDLTRTNTFTGGVVIKSNTAAFIHASTGVAGGAFGLGNLTLEQGATLLTDGRSHANTNIFVTGDIAIGATPTVTGGAARLSLAGIMDLGGITRTVTLGRVAASAAHAITNGNSAVQFITVNGQIFRLDNGRLNFVIDPDAAATNYAGVVLGVTCAFTNTGFNVGARVIATVAGNGHSPFDGRPQIHVNSGGYLSVGDGASGGRLFRVGGLSGSGQVVNFWRGAAAAGQLYLQNNITGGTYEFAGQIQNTDTNVVPDAVNGTLSVFMAGTFTQVFSGTNSYTGATTVAGGKLIINGDNSAATGGISCSAGTLGGNGRIGGVVNVYSVGSLEPGFNGIGKLTLASGLSMNIGGGTNLMEVARNGATLTNDLVDALTSTVDYGLGVGGGSVLRIVNVGSSPLQPGDTFKLYNAATYTGAFDAIEVPAGYTFTNNLAVDGTVGVASVPAVVTPTPTNITYTVTGNELVLSWPNGQGWKLQSQTNALSTGIATNWTDVSPAPSSPYTNTVNPANPTVFYRLVYP